MGYWNSVVVKYLPKVENITEDWDKRTVSFELGAADGSLTVDIDQEFIEWVVQTFGSRRLSITARPDTRYSRDPEYNYMTGVILQFVVKGVCFPRRPGE